MLDERHPSPQIFELFGYPIDSWTREAHQNMVSCRCPFMDAPCDGGGNRFASSITINSESRLKAVYPDMSQIQAGVCSLQLHPGEQPWIVCPRRLLNYRAGITENHQEDVKRVLCEKSGLVKGTRYSVWNEVKLISTVRENGKVGRFDYTFDYIITGRERKSLADISRMLHMSPSSTQAALVDSGFTTCCRNGEMFCEDFPSAPFVIVEVMTSSTSGGNKRKRTQVAQLFEDTVLKLCGVETDPRGPGINYRQVWARMVSQLLVKSQIGRAWGGVTFWVLQDLLAQYISETTALDFSDFLARHSDEVNIIAGGYGDEITASRREGALAQIRDVKFYSGKVAPSLTNERTFSDIIKLGCTPPRSELVKKLIAKRPCATFVF